MKIDEALRCLRSMERKLIESGPHKGRCYEMLRLVIEADGSGYIEALTREWSAGDPEDPEPCPKKLLRRVFTEWSRHRAFDGSGEMACTLTGWDREEANA